MQAALAFLAAPAVFTVIWIIGNWIAIGEVYWRYARTAWGTYYPLFLTFELIGTGGALGLLVALRSLTIVRLMLWASLITGVACFGWIASEGLSSSPLWMIVLPLAIAVIYGFFNTGVFALLAGLWRWPAVREARAASATPPPPSS